ncbi:MAG: GntR family transcriptional regulator [Variovorax sp.]|nr:MAG: GntR family transcriptional regulator [Variovorax sp.]
MADFDTGLKQAERDFPNSLAAVAPRGVPQGRVTHASAVRMAIESDIFTGKLLPGTPIDEDALAERFAVSRTPVREAMLQLLQAGLIEKRPRRPATVARLDLPRLIHMFETISELEALCARFAATRITSREKEALIETHERSAEMLALGDEAEYARLGRRFHVLIMRATHNNVLIETTDKLALHTLSYRRFQLRQGGRAEANQADHGRVLEAIIAGDGTGAAELMRRHVTVQGDVLAEYISSGEVTHD